jgi:hypothetical protein
MKNTSRRLRGLLLLSLFTCLAASGQVRITEFMASNSHTLADEDGDYSDWIEIQNTATTNVNLLNWYLADKPSNLTKWAFPSTNLPPGNFMIVFASNKNRRTPGKPLHTNFKLSADGEYLALVMPDGVTIATQFYPTFPPQLPDVSYGFGLEAAANLLLTTNATGRVLVPTDGTLGTDWTATGFNDAAWRAATNGIGFETGQSEDPGSVSADVLADNPAGYWRLGETSGTVATNSGWIAGTGNGQFVNGVVNGVVGPRPPAFNGFESGNLAARFNGSGAKVEVPYTPDLNPSAAFTVEAWVRPSSTNSSTGSLVSSMNVSGSSRYGYALYQNYSDAPNQWEFKLGNNLGYIASAHGGMPDTNNWQYLAGVYDGSTAWLYVNGSLVASATLSSAFVPNTSQKLDIGGRSDGSYNFAGDVDEVSVIARALSAAEIATRYQVATNGVAPTNVFNYTGLIKTDLRTNMLGSNSSAYLRLPFNVTNAAAINGLTLRVRYDDGFAAFLNGALVASDNAPATPAWNSSATNRRQTADALQFNSFDLTAAIGYLQNGASVLALQGLNVSATNADFLLQVELEADSYQYSTEGRYFTQPTPGALNVAGVKDLGPILYAEGFSPALPGTNDSITVTCGTAQTFAPVTNVTLNWRVMYDALQPMPMYDDGLHGDGAAGDGVYGAIITNHVGANWTYAAGQMVRWYVTAVDSLSHTSRWPLFTDPNGSAEYDGTVINPNYVTSALPIIHLFAPTSVLQPGPITSQTGADSQGGGRVSLYYDGEFYDNINMNLRGNTTAWYNKKSHRLNFNKEHAFRYSDSAARITKTSFEADYPDPSYMRQGMSFWLDNLVGVPPPFCYPVRLQLNGAFYELATHSDVQETEMLERIGYNPTGAYYANVGTAQPGGYSTGGFEKKTRPPLTDYTDYNDLINALAPYLSTGQKLTNLFDRLDVPEVISYMVAARFSHQNDDVWAGMALYHDNDGDDLWRILPYDQNLSWGAAWMDAPAYYGIQVTNDDLKSFPMYGSSQAVPSTGGGWNGMYDLIFQVPQTCEMFLRSIRTMLDTYVKPPGTPVGTAPVDQTIIQWRDLIAADSLLDRAWWGWPDMSGQCNFDPGIDLTNGVNILLNDFVNNRRSHFYGKHSVTNTALPIGITKTSNAGIPLAQASNAVVSIVGWDYNPVSGNQDEEYVLLSNTNGYAVDISGWELNSGIHFKFQFGTVIPTGGTLYVSPNTKTFRNRATSPHGGQGLFVVGPYSGHLNAWGESLTLTDNTGRLVSSNSFAGSPSLAQQYLRITEIMYNPSPAPAINSDAQQFEYVELKNISTSTTLNLTGVRFTNGVYFNFTGSAVTSLAPGQIVLVVHNQSAFTARYGSGFSIAGQYTGALNNGGETLRLEDAVGEKILEFAYDNTWYPITDGLGFSLVIVNENAPWDTWGLQSSWRASGQLNGSPGTTDPQPPAFPPVRVNEALTHSNPGSDWIELYNPAATNVDLSGWFLTDDFFNPMRYRIPAGTILAPGGYLVFTGTNSFELGTNGFRLSEYGEQVYLFSADATPNLTGYYHGFDFGAAPNGVSFGRYITSQGQEHFVLQSANTPGTNNALPRIGSIIISEIMYHPPDIGGADDYLDEYIELHNITATNVPLYCTFTNEAGYGLAAVTNTWCLRNAVDYDFPTNVTVAAAGRLLVTSFDPVANPAQLAAFRALYNVATNVPIFGPWSGKLDNGGETIELMSPNKPDVTSSNVTVPYVLEEQIDYQPVTPWPANADGLGSSLQRLVLNAYGNDPTNWTAALPSAGSLNASSPPPVITVISRPGVSVSIEMTTAPGLTYQLEYKNDLTDATWTPLPPPLPAGATTLILTDSNSPATKRFYRIQAQ